MLRGHETGPIGLEEPRVVGPVVRQARSEQAVSGEGPRESFCRLEIDGDNYLVAAVVERDINVARVRRRKAVDFLAWAGDRKPGPDGKIASVGNTVDVANATWTNTIGAPELITVWKDPDFDPTQPAFYYGRVIEIPTPRWTAYDAKRFGNKPLPGTRMTIAERAYTSPIWYTPN